MKYYICDENYKRVGNIALYNATPPEPIKEGKRIALVVGHDSDRKGAYGNAGVSEWDFNTELLTDLAHGGYLPKQHTFILYYRSEDINGYTAKMIDLHKRMDADNIDYSIEFHFNSVADSSVNGNEVLFCSTKGMELAKKLDEALDRLPNRDRGIKKVSMSDQGGGFCCRGGSVAIIAEPFFGSQQDQYMPNGEHRELLKECYKTFFNNL